MQNSFKGKRALLTGSSSGIGFHVALMLGEAGVTDLMLNGSPHSAKVTGQVISVNGGISAG
jgi:hypothetical protein